MTGVEAISDVASDAEQRAQSATIESISASVLADTQRSFASQVDTAMLQQHVRDVVGSLWTESTRITTFIPVLALRDLRDRLDSDPDPSRV